MEINNSIKFIREKIRQNCQIQRNKQRFEENDSFRLGLGEIKSLVDELDNLTEKDVHGLCVRIKRRKHAGPDDLFRLSQAFLHSSENITIFAKIPGALQIIIKELTGHDSEQQIRAAETLCNLSLGDEIVCEKIAIQAGSYLITFLDSIDFRLKQSCIWTLINIVSTGTKGLEILLTMEIISKCSDLFYSNNCFYDSNLIEDAVLCLNLIFKNKSYDVLRVNISGFFERMTTIPFEDGRNKLLMEIIFNSSIIKSQYNFNDKQLEYIANTIIHDILNTTDFTAHDSTLKILYNVRVLSNIIYMYKSRFLIIFKKTCLDKDTNLINFINSLFNFQNESFKNEILWLLKNVISAINDETKSKELICEIKIPTNI